MFQSEVRLLFAKINCPVPFGFVPDDQTGTDQTNRPDGRVIMVFSKNLKDRAKDLRAAEGGLGSITNYPGRIARRVWGNFGKVAMLGREKSWVQMKMTPGWFIELGSENAHAMFGPDLNGDKVGPVDIRAFAIPHSAIGNTTWMCCIESQFGSDSLVLCRASAVFSARGLRVIGDEGADPQEDRTKEGPGYGWLSNVGSHDLVLFNRYGLSNSPLVSIRGAKKRREKGQGNFKFSIFRSREDCF